MSPLVPEAPPQSFGRFFLPGPTEVRPPVLEAQNRAMISHRGPANHELMGELQVGLQEVFQTERSVFISTSSATGLMEAAVRNGAHRRVLSLVCGAFSGRFANIAEQCGKDVDRVAAGWGSANTAEQLRDALESGGPYDAVTAVHSETSTGALNDIEALAAVMEDYPDTVLLVDSVTGIGGAEMRPDAWGVDFVLTGSHKALAVPPGLAFGVASEAMMERARTVEGRGMYFDLVAFDRKIAKLQTPNTPAVPVMYALAEQLRHIRSETMEVRWARHTAMAERTWSWVDGMRAEGVEVCVFAEEGSRSPTVTCIALPTGTAGPGVVAAMKERDWVLGGGYGDLAPTCIRIGHMGDHTRDKLDELLDDLADVLT